MADQDPLLPLIKAWQDARDRGLDPTPEELCVKCPELTDQLAERISALQKGEGAQPGKPAKRKTTPAPGLNDPRVPDRLANYKLLGLLGKGGMGAVFRAEDLNLGRQVALKVILPSQVDNLTVRSRFMREARAQAQVDHENVVPIYHVDQHDGIPFIAMPLLQGETLDQRLRRDRVLPLDAAVRIAREVAEGLAAAHAQGLVHRDIKPSNVWLEGDPKAADAGTRLRRVKILDFGLALPVHGDARLTVKGAFIGTPAYMSPEQGGGLKVDHRTDLFSLGVMLYEMVVGRDPFYGVTPAAVIVNVATKNPAPARAVNQTVPPDLSGLIAEMMEKTPDHRPGSAREVADRLAEIEAQFGPRPKGAPPSTVRTLAPKDRTPEPGPGPGTLAGTETLAPSAPPGPPSVTEAGEDHPAPFSVAPTQNETFWRQPEGRKYLGLAAVLGVAVVILVVGVVVFLPDHHTQVPPVTGNIPVPPETVEIRITSAPDGATVRVIDPDRSPDPAARVTTPATLAVRPSVRECELSKPGYVTQKFPLDPSNQKEYQFRLAVVPEPPPPPVTVRVRVNPPAAVVKLLGEPGRAPTPGRTQGEFAFVLPPGRKRTVRAEAEGYAPREIEVDTAASGEYTITLAPATVRVVFRGLPAGAAVEFVGEPDVRAVPGTAGEYTARRGEHRVKITAKGYEDGMFTVRAPAADEDRVEVPASLKPLPPPVEYTDGQGLQFKLIPAGRFTLGYDEPANKLLADNPLREVTITRPFYLARYEVTRGQFAKFVGETKYKTDAEKSEGGGYGYDPKFEAWFKQGKRFHWRDAGFAQTDEHPVVNVTWNDAKAYCDWLSKKENRAYRLPTEAEWEYAARSGRSDQSMFKDDTVVVGFANVADDSTRNRLQLDGANIPKCFPGDDGFAFTASVGRLRPNGYGLYDMYGNALEWCEDWYGRKLELLPTKNPRQLVENVGRLKVARGGFFMSGQRELLLVRYPLPVDDARAVLGGFRVLLEVDRP